MRARAAFLSVLLLAAACGADPEPEGAPEQPTDVTIETPTAVGESPVATPSPVATAPSAPGEDPPAPLIFGAGEELSLTVPDRSVTLRPGETRTVDLSFTSFGPTEITYPLSWSDLGLRPGVSIASSLPSSLIVPAGATVTVSVDVTADAAALPGDAGGLFSVRALHPTLPDGLDPASARVQVEVVAIGTTVGPAVAEDLVVVPTGSAVVVDVLANDAAGDAPLDPASINVVSQPDQGTVTPNGDGTLTVDASAITTPDIGLFGAAYEICDTAGQCATTTLNIQTTVP